MTSTTASTTVPAQDSTNLAVLGELLKLSCVELLADYGLETQTSAAPTQAEPPVSVLVAGVDFNGHELRGTVSLWATRTVFAQTTRGAPGMSAAEEELPDWACELANQLLGRMKNKLRSYDVSLTVNVPRLIAGADLGQLDKGVRHRFSCAFGPIAACLDALITPGFLLKERATDDPLIQEGDFELL